MNTRTFLLTTAPLFLAATTLLGPAALAGGDASGDAALVQALPNAKCSLLEGVRKAAKSPPIAISAKFEDEGKGLSLSVYTAGRGADVEAEANVLQELAGDPTQAEWKPTTETFADVQHVARASEQLTLMRTTKRSLGDAIASADSYLQHFHDATVFSIAPAVRDGRGVFLVGVAVAGQAYHLVFDLQTGTGLEPWPRMPWRPLPTPLVGKTLTDPVVGKGQWVGPVPAPLAEAARTRVVLVATNSYLCEGTDEAYAWPRLTAWYEELAPKGLDVRFVVGEAPSAADVEAYVARRKIAYPVLHDPTGANAGAWDLGRIAFGLLLDAEGKVVWQGRIGPPYDADGCEAAIREQIRLRTAAGTLAPR
jgi:hypothetical protein